MYSVLLLCQMYSAFLLLLFCFFFFFYEQKICTAIPDSVIRLPLWTVLVTDQRRIMEGWTCCSFFGLLYFFICAMYWCCSDWEQAKHSINRVLGLRMLKKGCGTRTVSLLWIFSICLGLLLILEGWMPTLQFLFASGTEVEECMSCNWRSDGS